MKFETFYRKSIKEVRKDDFSCKYSYELALYNNFILRLTDNDYLIKSYRHSVIQNALQTIETGREHIKMVLREIYSMFFLVCIGDTF